MTAVTQERLDKVAHLLWAEVYEEKFRGKDRGRFVLTREQLKAALGVERLHATTIAALQDAALRLGLVIIDLDDVFPCIENKVVRKYRRPPNELFERLLKTTFPNDVQDDDNSDEGDDEEQ